MKKIVIVSIILISVLAFKINQGYSVEPSYKVTFAIGSWLGTCNGTIGGVKGNIHFDDNDLTKSFFNIGFDVNTLNTSNSSRDGHLKKEDYFDVAKFPTIIFKSSAITKTASGYSLEGNLTIKAITKKINFPFTFKDIGASGIFTGTLNINRVDYAVGTSDWKVKDEVNISISLPVKKI